LPAFGGEGMYGIRVHEAVIRSGAKITGVSVHFVDEVYDHGAIIYQKAVPVRDDDTPESLQKRVLKVEHKVYPYVVGLFASRKIEVKGGRVYITRK
jgi:folate-dependent phosphoribosylglycinamide formyltransferase PurN